MLFTFNGIVYEHCVKSVQIRVFSGLYFPVFSPNTGKYEPEKNPYFDTFHAVETQLKIFFDLTLRSVKNWFWFFPDLCENLPSTKKLKILAKSSSFIIFPLISTPSSYLFLKLWSYSGWAFRVCSSMGEGK